MASGEKPTPKKARIQGICDYLDAKGIPYHHSDVFRHERVSKTTGWKILRQSRDLEPRTFHSIYRETRGRRKKLTEEDLDVLEAFIIDNGYDSRTLRWQDLPAEAGLEVEVSGETVRRRLKEREFRRCQACQKEYVSPRLAERRQGYARVTLERYPQPEDWRHIRFSDETHFGWGPEGKVYVIRRPWERQCPDCVVERREPPAKDLKRLHAWAAVGYDFKSSLHWYNVPGNTNGKMTLQVYRDEILESVVGSWLRQGHSFVLEEDNDSGHGTGKANIVRTWKKQNGLDSFFNCASSPDFVPIEKAFLIPKDYVRTQSCWDDETLKSRAEEGWEKLKQSTINVWVDDIPKILKQVADSDQLAGRMSGF